MLDPTFFQSVPKISHSLGKVAIRLLITAPYHEIQLCSIHIKNSLLLPTAMISHVLEILQEITSEI